MTAVEPYALLLFLASLVAIIAHRARFPYTVGLVIAGLAIAATGLAPDVALTGDLIFFIFLPPLVFEAAFAIDWRELKRDLLPAISFATFGVAVATGVIATGMHFLVGWDWAPSLLFGSLISATDPVSVIALFKETKVKGRLRLLVESESLLNDGVAAVLFVVVLGWVTGEGVTAVTIGIDLVREVVGGLLVGAGVGWAALTIAGKTDDHLVEITFTTVAAYGSFLIAAHFHSSGVLAALACGLMLGNRGSLGAITDRGREATLAFWEYAAFVVNSLIFLLIGIREQRMMDSLASLAPALGIGFLVVTLSRAFAVYPMAATFAKTRWRIDRRHQHVMFWGGLRGALALALALGLPEDLPYRHEVLATSFGVVALSIVLQGLTMPALMRKLKLVDVPNT